MTAVQERSYLEPPRSAPFIAANAEMHFVPHGSSNFPHTFLVSPAKREGYVFSTLNGSEDPSPREVLTPKIFGVRRWRTPGESTMEWPAERFSGAAPAMQQTECSTWWRMDPPRPPYFQGNFQKAKTPRIPFFPKEFPEFCV